ncbi:Histidine kinase-, DNA gyrase B-, and HSP90-like ATPase [Paenibacillus sp. UNCCL117]|uniref:sensor histidine kinase n=1 Tax=unclassified Paenibacillus TaxID=185978 RepID=UPI00088B0C53|nr:MULTISPECIES: histidine kinase [unclassified Paenibacillus]SDE45876.1 Histidine kinase-, DNA gyrase B-, and HSP90-like ATPase [Paenibacillus sp. cl123]SFW65975.1 Histidine kinase-, DNA gyrase B-, and HSP90-like ATPase [Paenibacillus sp. UNCCL117]
MLLQMKNRLRLNLYARISLLLLAAVSVPTVFLGYLSFFKSSEQIQTVTEAFLADNLRHNALRIDALMSDIQLQSEKVLQSDELKLLLKSPPPDGLLSEFDFIRQINPLVSQLSGEYELQIYPKEPLRYPNYAEAVKGDEDWFRQALVMEGRGFWKLLEPETADGKPSEVLYVRAIRDFPLLQPLGVLTLRAPGYLFTQELMIPERVDKLGFSLIHETGGIIASKANGDRAACPLLRGQTDGRSASRLSADGAGCYEADQPLAIRGWRLAAAVPAAELMGPVRSIKEFTWLLVVSGLAVMSLLLLLIVRKVTVPIKLLVRHMRKILLGELAYFQGYERRNDEIGQLVRGYNTMITGMIEHLERTRQFEEEKSRLEMRTLIHQINPHFLYNTMDTIKWKADRAGVPAIVAMVTALSNLLRFSINNGEELTTVERELEHVRSYLSIEQMRHQDSFSVFVQVQPNLLQLPFMKLTLQPMVENAVKHAMKKLPGEASGKMLISLSRTGEGIVCSVEDNGPGADIDLRAHFAALEQQGGGGASGGVGLYNVDRRLKLRFGPAYGITLERRDEGGCRARLLHPVLDHDMSSAEELARLNKTW